MLLQVMAQGGFYNFGEGATNVRKLVSGAWVPTVEGVDTRITENATKVQLLRTLQFAMNTVRRIRDGKLYYRVYLPVSTEVSFWNGNTALWAQWLTGWVDIICEYTEDNRNRYIINGVVRYSGPVRTTIGFYASSASGTYLFDTGGRGGVLPAGCEWW